MSKRIMVVLSGGMDSATLLHLLQRQGHELRAISVNYNQRHRKELRCARRLCSNLAVPLIELDLSVLSLVMKGSSQSDPAVAVPHGKYDEPSMKLTVVPNRNMVLLAVACAAAISEGCEAVAYGAHAGDLAIYPDCRPEFVDAMQAAFQLCDWSKIELLAPFVGIHKGDIAKIGVDLGVPYGDTWTCYEGGERPCGKCGSCTERAEAFEHAGVPDPLITA